MKTPKRHYELTTMEHSACERVWDRPQEEVSAQRWKRKNRVKQLKRSLHRYRDCTNLPFYCHELHAYKMIQELNRPTEKSPVEKWESYVLDLSEIIAHLEEARTWAHLAKHRKQEEQAEGKESI